MDVKIVATSPNNKDANVQLDRDIIVEADFNIPINNPYITIDSIVLKRENSSQQFIENPRIDKNKVSFSISNLENFTQYSISIQYSIIDIYQKPITKIKTWSFSTESGLEFRKLRDYTTILGFDSNSDPIKSPFLNRNEMNCNSLDKPEKQDVFSYISNHTIIGSSASEAILGSNENDTIYGHTGADAIYGSDGNDTIYGGLGNDYLSGRNGNDRLYAGLGNDYLSGRNGNDCVYAGLGNKSMLPESDISFLTRVPDEIESGSGNDVIVSDGYDYINCGPGIDKVNNTTRSKYLNCEEITID